MDIKRKELHPVFLKTRTGTETGFKIEDFNKPGPTRDPGFNFLTDQDRDEIEINHRSSGREQKHKKGKGKQLPSWSSSTLRTSLTM